MTIEELISECTAYDFKLMLEEKRTKSWLKSVSAFANGMGGSLFFGVGNDGVIVGLNDIQSVTDTESILEGLHNSIAHKMYESGSRIIVTEDKDKLIF